MMQSRTIGIITSVVPGFFVDEVYVVSSSGLTIIAVRTLRQSWVQSKHPRTWWLNLRDGADQTVLNKTKRRKNKPKISYKCRKNPYIMSPESSTQNSNDRLGSVDPYFDQQGFKRPQKYET
jgi:hypothetical protein